MCNFLSFFFPPRSHKYQRIASPPNSLFRACSVIVDMIFLSIFFFPLNSECVTLLSRGRCRGIAGGNRFPPWFPAAALVGRTVGVRTSSDVLVPELARNVPSVSNLTALAQRGGCGNTAPSALTLGAAGCLSARGHAPSARLPLWSFVSPGVLLMPQPSLHGHRMSSCLHESPHALRVSDRGLCVPRRAAQLA